jgi:hypothetical protein
MPTVPVPLTVRQTEFESRLDLIHEGSRTTNGSCEAWTKKLEADFSIMPSTFGHLLVSKYHYAWTNEMAKC